jgi:hypothetical protein
MKRLLLILLFTTTARGQAVQISGGSSTLLNASGGAVTLYTPNSTSQASLGINDGHLVAGLSTHFIFHGWETYLGDKQVFFTSVSLGLAVPARGIFLQRKGPRYEVAFFNAAVGQLRTTPFFSGLEASHFGGGTSIRYFLSDELTFGTIQAVASGKLTSLEEAAWHHSFITLGAAGGWLDGKRLLNGRTDARWKHFGANLTRQTFIDPQRVDVTSEGVTLAAGRFDGYASAFQSQQSGEAVGAGVRIGWVQLRANSFRSSNGHSSTLNLAETITRRWSLFQFVSRSDGHSALNFGGSYRSNLVTASVDWQTYFDPTSGFRQLPAASLDFQLPRSIALHLSLLGTKWTAYGGMFVASGLGLGNASTPLRRPKLIDYEVPHE